MLLPLLLLPLLLLPQLCCCCPCCPGGACYTACALRRHARGRAVCLCSETSGDEETGLSVLMPCGLGRQLHHPGHLLAPTPNLRLRLHALEQLITFEQAALCEALCLGGASLSCLNRHVACHKRILICRREGVRTTTAVFLTCLVIHYCCGWL